MLLSINIVFTLQLVDTTRCTPLAQVRHIRSLLYWRTPNTVFDLKKKLPFRWLVVRLSWVVATAKVLCGQQPCNVSVGRLRCKGPYIDYSHLPMKRQWHPPPPSRPRVHKRWILGSHLSAPQKRNPRKSDWLVDQMVDFNFDF